ncbi:hypothetical protein B0O44_11254 [Pedobacter nutrimenti]|uniref:Uncharacterized protein n=1 Tax=Pedobacter nutrimenti TaxID=1241337 RepID=A0A318UAI4_9SPHI|nr:hypothetical protein B0O44_11254 [Pedobacter nutrimenti]
MIREAFIKLIRNIIGFFIVAGFGSLYQIVFIILILISIWKLFKAYKLQRNLTRTSFTGHLYKSNNIGFKY